MYRLILNFCSILVLGMSGIVSSQDYYAYKESGDLVELTIQDSVISVKPADGVQFSDEIFAAEPALIREVPPEPICDGFYRLRVVPGNDMEALVERLRVRTDVSFANVSFVDAHRNPIYITETFVANFDNSVTRSQIDSMNAAHSVEIVASLFGDPFWLELRVTRNSDLDVLSMGNAYHESSLVQFSRAGMVLNLKFYSAPNDEYWQYQWQFQNT